MRIHIKLARVLSVHFDLGLTIVDPLLRAVKVLGSKSIAFSPLHCYHFGSPSIAIRYPPRNRPNSVVVVGQIHLFLGYIRTNLADPHWTNVGSVGVSIG